MYNNSKITNNIILKFNIKLKLLLILLLCLSSKYLTAQTLQPTIRNGDVIDKIVGIVGNEIILKSDIDAELLFQIESGNKLDFNDEMIRRRLLNQVIDNSIIIVKAEEDSITVSEEMVEERWNYNFEQLLRTYGSIERIENVLKKSISRQKMEAKDYIRKRLMAQQLEMKKFSNVTVTTKEVEEFYELLKDSLPMIPVQVELFHIVRNIAPDTLSKRNTYQLAKKVRDTLLSGADFAEYAKKYSGDLGSIQDGGNLGWAGKGKFVPEFERAAYSLQNNEISMPVETPFGYHLIKLIEKRKDSIHTSHILFKLIQTDTDISKVRKLLDSLRLVAIENNNFQQLAMEFSEEKETKGFGGALGKFQMDMLPTNIANTIRNLKDGEISEPSPYTNDPTKQGMNIVWKKATIAEHKPTLETDYEYIKKWATDYKIEELRKKWIAELKAEIYWEIID
jgi:peptidyl-prolyl cis-trans isomerase SurA